MMLNYLGIGTLLNLSYQIVTNMITGKTPAEIRALLNMENDFTPEEEEKIRKESQWAFEWVDDQIQPVFFFFLFLCFFWFRGCKPMYFF